MTGEGGGAQGTACLEGGEQLRGEVADEADGVRQNDGAPRRQVHSPHRRVQRRKQLVLRPHIVPCVYGHTAPRHLKWPDSQRLEA